MRSTQGFAADTIVVGLNDAGTGPRFSRKFYLAIDVKIGLTPDLVGGRTLRVRSRQELALSQDRVRRSAPNISCFPVFCLDIVGGAKRLQALVIQNDHSAFSALPIDDLCSLPSDYHIEF